MKPLFAVLPAIMMAAAIAMPSRAESFAPKSPAVQDTLILKMKNQSKVLVVVKDLKDIKSLKSQSLDSLIVLLEKHVDQIERAGKSAAENPVTITIDKGEGVGKEDVNITITQASGDKKQIISKEIKNVRIDVDVEKDNDKTTVGINMQKDTVSTEEKEDKKPKERYERKTHDFQFEYGAARWANTGATPGSISPKPSFRPIASRYIGLTNKWHRRIGGAGSPARFSSGFAFEFHNYMFDDNQALVTDGETSFMNIDSRELEKSKLATTSFTIPLEISFDVKNKDHNTVFRIGGGGFVGYMLGSKTKLVYSEGGDTKKVKVHNDYNLNDLQYGVSGFIGLRDMDIFAKYNLNDMFKDNRGPKGNSLALGLRWNM